MELKVKLQANNCLRVTVQTEPYKRKSRGDSQQQKERDRKNEQAMYRQQLEYELAIASEAGTSLLMIDGVWRDVEWARQELEKIRCFNLYLESRTKPERKHSAWFRVQTEKSFSPYARQSILECGTVIDREHRDRSALLTLTIPGSHENVLKTVSEASGWIVDRQLNLVRKAEDRDSFYCFFVWEFQGRGALHQHWCISHANSYERAEQMAREIERMWFKCLWELKLKTGVDCFERRRGDTWRYKPEVWRSDLQKVNKSVGGYFAKYASKTAKHLDRLHRYKSRRIYYPSRWWGCTSNLKQAVQSWRIEAKVTNLDRKGVRYIAKQLTDMFTDVYKPVLQTRKEFDVEKTIYKKDGTKETRSYCKGITKTFYFDHEQFPEIWEALKLLIIGENGNIRSRSDEYTKQHRTWLERMAGWARGRLGMYIASRTRTPKVTLDKDVSTNENVDMPEDWKDGMNYWRARKWKQFA